MPAMFKHWIEWCWHQDPDRRPTCFDLMKDIRSKMDETGITDEENQDPAAVTTIIELRASPTVQFVLSTMTSNVRNERLQRWL
jgi:hypothetical protein